MTVLICLVSEQRMQNIIPVFQRDASIQQTWMVRSNDADEVGSRFWRAQQDTRQALSGNTEVLDVEHSVGAYGIEETKKVVAEAISRADDDAVVNFTGGTKCMSVGAYLAAQSAGVPAMYVDTANEKVIWFYPDGLTKEEAFDLGGRLTVRIYLRANDRRVDEERIQKYILPDQYYQAARELTSQWPECRETLHALGMTVSKQGTTVPDGQVSRETISLLQRFELVEYLSGGWLPSRQGRSFLGGKWLDAMTHTLLSDSGLFDDIQPEMRLQGIENELDVMLTRNGVLGVLECKSGDLGGQTTLNRLQALRSNLGTFARSFFVTSRNANQVDLPFRSRAKEYGVREIITSETLLDVANIIKNKMSGTPS